MRNSPPKTTLLHAVPRHPLSIILSYLNEYDGTSVLITDKFFSRNILPIFEVPPELVTQKHEEKKKVVRGESITSPSSITMAPDADDTCDSTQRGKLCAKQRRHRFLSLPVEDPEALLERLNTRRLYRRIIYFKDLASNGAELTEKISAVKCAIDCYRKNMTTEELAEYEYVQLGLLCKCHSHRSCSNATQPQSTTVPNAIIVSSYDESAYELVLRKLPAQLELLRFRKSKTECLPFSGGIKCSCCCTVSSRGAIKSSSFIGAGGATLLASYPRSGNSLLRSLMERMTGIVTGSDTRPDRTLSKELASAHNMVGEGLISADRVHVIKTHFPERRGWKVVQPNRVILLTRNPFDAIDSYFNMALTNTHTKTLADSVYEQYCDLFEGMAKSEIQTWKEFHEYWFQSISAGGSNDVVKTNGTGNGTVNSRGKGCNVPMLVLRYEDLLIKPHESMARVISFMIGIPLSKQDDRLPPFWEERLHHVLGPKRATTVADNSSTFPGCSNGIPYVCDSNAEIEEQSARALAHLGSYKPRSGGIGKSIRKGRFSKELLEDMHNTSGAMLRSFRYDVLTQDFPNTIENGMPRRERVFVNCNDKAASNTYTGLLEIYVNIGKELRASNNPYGRNITLWRKCETMEDSKPLPTIDDEKK